MAIRIGIDTGGTFTDLVLVDDRARAPLFHKVSSTPDDPGRALVQGIVEIAAKAGVDPASAALLVHGTTVATNAVLQRVGARTAFVTTAGFRDVLHIQRQDRPSLYDLRSRRAAPLAPRELRLELRERMLFDGSVATAIDPASLADVIAALRAADVEAVGVGLLHSYANPTHEQAVGAAIAAALPGVTVCLSHELSGEYGEYERFSTCAMNAFVQPTMQRYLDHLDAALRAAGIGAPLFVMKSNGGVMAAPAAGRAPVQTILSGPAGGVVAGAALATANPPGNLITADMGGTSFDVAVIHGGRVAFARDAEMGGLALGVPMLDIHTVGAGGGSIGWIDAGGSLRVGPRSAGAVPGPACYGRGGTLPTVTDANLVLGRLAPKSLLGGDMQIDLAAAREAVRLHLAAPLGLSIEAAAEGMIRVVNAAMTAAIRKLTVERGVDPRSFALCPFGGAGPLHGAELAAELGIAEVLVPLAPGVQSALGLLMSGLREDRLQTWVRPWAGTDVAELETRFAAMLADARARLGDVAAGESEGSAKSVGAPPSGSPQQDAAADQDAALTVRRRVGLRYLGQRYELPVPLPAGTPDLEALAEAFHAAHEQAYGFRRDGEALELASLWLAAELTLHTVDLPAQPVDPADAGCPPVVVEIRDVIFRGVAHPSAVYRRPDLRPGMAFAGPAIVEQLDTTTVVWPGQRVTVDAHGALRLSVSASPSGGGDGH